MFIVPLPVFLYCSLLYNSKLYGLYILCVCYAARLKIALMLVILNEQ